MAGGDWSNPTISSNYVSVITEIGRKAEDSVTLLYSIASVSNLPTNAVRWNPSSNKFELWSGASWGDLSASYAINVTQVASAVPGNSSGDIALNNGTVNTNLNADLLDGQHASYFADTTLSNVTASTIIAAVKTVDGAGSGLDADLLDGNHSGNSSGQIPISNGTKCTNLNADLLDGYTIASICVIDDDETISGEWIFSHASGALFEQGVRTGGNTYGTSRVEFYDDTNNAFRSLIFDHVEADWYLHDSGGTKRKIHHAGTNSFRGCEAYISANVSTSDSSFKTINLNTENFDTDTIHSNVTNNSRLTVPSGATYVRLYAQIGWATNSTGKRTIVIQKNGSSNYNGYLSTSGDAGSGGVIYLNVQGIVQVTGGDYFEMLAFQSSGGALDVIGNTYGPTKFAMEIIQ